jgi:hypothetical protein
VPKIRVLLSPKALIPQIRAMQQQPARPAGLKPYSPSDTSPHGSIIDYCNVAAIAASACWRA